MCVVILRIHIFTRFLPGVFSPHGKSIVNVCINFKNTHIYEGFTGWVKSTYKKPRKYVHAENPPIKTLVNMCVAEYVPSPA